MAKQRYVNTRFWDDGYIVTLDPIEKLLFLYLLTNPLTNIVGAYELSLRRVAFDTGIDRDMILKIFERFEAVEKVYYRDGWVVLTNFIKHQSLNPKIISGIRAELAQLPPPIAALVNVEYEPKNKTVRKKVTASQRKRILVRDGHQCQFCKATDDLEIDHIVPVALGGDSEDANLRVLCQKCNGKRNAELRWTEQGDVVSKNSLPKEMGGLSHLNSNSNTNSIKSGTLSGRSGITRNMTPVNPAADLELNTWLGAVAGVVGASNKATLPKLRKWESVCMAAIREQRDLGKFLDIVKTEKDRTKGQEEFFSPDTCLQKLQLNGSARSSKWTHEV